MAQLTATQPEWFATDNPDVLLNIVRPPAAWPNQPEWPTGMLRRRLQLFSCACARMVWDLLPTDCQNAVLIRERFAEGRAAEADLRASNGRITGIAVTFQQHAFSTVGALSEPSQAARSAAKSLACRTAGPAPPGGNPVSAKWETTWNATYHATRAHQAELVRDIFPPPGYTSARNGDWLTDTVLAIARHADETGEYSALPILADALQDTGCDDEVMLSRCRAPSGIHCRGNWVVDLLLGRE